MSGGISTALIGEIRMFAGVVDVSVTSELEIKSGWLYCNGAFVSQSTHSDLFAYAGHLFNASVDPGNGSFKLPDFRGRTPIGLSNAGTFVTRGAVGGTTSHSLSVTESPPHMHGATLAPAGDHSHTGSTSNESSPYHTHFQQYYYGTMRTGGANNTFSFWSADIDGLAPFTQPLSGRSTSHIHEAATTTSSATHAHALSYGSMGSGSNNGEPHNNVSPYTLMHFMVKT